MDPIITERAWTNYSNQWKKAKLNNGCDCTWQQHNFPLVPRRYNVSVDHFLYSSFTHATSFLRVSKARQMKWSAFQPYRPLTSKTKGQWLVQQMHDGMQLPLSSVKISNIKGKLLVIKPALKEGQKTPNPLECREASHCVLILGLTCY